MNAFAVSCCIVMATWVVATAWMVRGSAFANPGDLPILLALVGGAAGLTALVTFLVGRRIARSNPAGAAVACSALVPGVMIAVGFIHMATVETDSPDGPGMLFMALTAVAFWLTPVCGVVAGLVIHGVRRRPASSS